MKRPVKRATKRSAKKTTNRPSKRAANHSAKRPVKRAVKRPARRPAKRAVKRPAGRSAKRAVRRPVRRAARRAAAKTSPKRAFRRGDTVMHWSYGLGTVARLENRELLGKKTLYYAVQVGDMTVWVPNDDQLSTRLRRPSSRGQLPRLRTLLTKPGVTLSQDRHERKTLLAEMLKDGRPESLCKVIRSLVGFARTHPLNDNDQALLKRAQTALLAEWSYALDTTPEQAEAQLHKLISVPTSGVAQ